MGKYQNMWSQRTKIIFRELKIIFHPLGSLACFLARAIVPWQENVRDTRNASLVDVVFKCLRQRSKYVCQQYFTCMCFLGFIRYNNTFIACGFRKYEINSLTSIIFPSGVSLREYDSRGWINFHIYRLPIKAYYSSCTLRHIRIEIIHGSHNVLWDLTWVGG